jgi:hypothetical protein
MRPVFAFTIGLISICPLCVANAQTANCSISGGINNGIQIQNCPIIEQAPTPSFHVVQEFPIIKNADGTFIRAILIEIDAPYVPNNMILVATGKTVLSLVVSNKGMIFGGPGTNPTGPRLFWVSQPSGDYRVEVKTSDEKTPPALQLAFNQKINLQ